MSRNEIELLEQQRQSTPPIWNLAPPHRGNSHRRKSSMILNYKFVYQEAL